MSRGAKVGHIVSNATREKISRSVTKKQLGKYRLPLSILALLQDKEWLYEQRITLIKSKDLIAKELGISVIPINKWLKIHNIPAVRYNESNATALAYLRNKEWLYDAHINQRLTCDEIAAKINSSKATISVWMERHNIVANDSNSYPRKKIIISKGCQEIIDFIKGFYLQPIEINVRGIIGNLELDIYLPESKLAIEYNGVWSHLYRPNEPNLSLRKDKHYHVNKTDLCNKRGVQLIHIWSSSWDTKKDIWKSIIRTKLGHSKFKVGARNCLPCYVDLQDVKLFLNENHIQGVDKSKIKVGLKYKDELLSVMTFGAARFNNIAKMELLRFCVKKDWSIMGGFSKLFKFVSPQLPCVSYADRMYSDGGVYIKNGFSLLHVNPPGYWYVKNGSEILEHRSKYRKGRLDPNSTLTEWEQMQARKYSKIFDCGTLTYLYK